MSKSGDRDYSNFSIEKYSRAALINQGFDVCEIDISHGDTIPSLINIVVLAEMRTPLTEKGKNQPFCSRTRMTLVFSSFLDMALSLGFCIVAILPPFGGVGVNIAPNAEIVRLAADDVVVVAALPDSFSTSHCNGPF